jgi:hypothetical protein
MRVTRSLSKAASLTRAILAASTLAVLVGASGSASAQTITATAVGSETPPIVPPDQSEQNGDFRIWANFPGAPATGDGIDEKTSWTFDFTSDPDYPISGPLLSAKLTLTVRPGNAGITTDFVAVSDPTFTFIIPGGPVNTPLIQSLPVGIKSTVVIELLNYYSSADILAALASNGGHLPMFHHDDVILSFAELELVSRRPDRPLECGSEVTRIQSVNRPGYISTMVDYAASGGGFDPTPLLQTKVDVSGDERSCLVVNFSTVAYPRDRFIVFQVQVDGVPMEGHLPGFAGFATPVVVDPDETDKKLPRMVAYTFFKEVKPGTHSVEVLFAGCCSASPPQPPSAFAGSPVLAVHYR